MSKEKEKNSRLINALFSIMSGLKKGVSDCCSENGDLAEKEFHIVVFTGQNNGVKMSEIANSICAPVSTVTSIVDKLVDRNYLERYHSSEDRRVILVSLASKGKETHSYFMSQKQDLAHNILSQFNEDEQDNLLSLLERMPLGL